MCRIRDIVKGSQVDKEQNDDEGSQVDKEQNDDEGDNSTGMIKPKVINVMSDRFSDRYPAIAQFRLSWRADSR